MASGGFDFSEFKQLAENFKKLEKGNRQFVEDFLLQMALRCMAETRKRTPVNVGDLRAAWYLSGIARRGNDVMINLINPKLYASWVEYGHRQEVGRFIPGTWSGNRFTYDPNAKTGMVLKNPWADGKFMVTLSIQEIEREMPRRFESAWAKYASGLLGGR